MQLFGFELTIRRKTLPPLRPLSSDRSGGWFPIVRESYPGAWQQNVEVAPASVLQNPTVFTCVTRISQDIGKMRLRLVERESEVEDIWTPTANPAYSPVLRRPNRYQLAVKFVEQWITSKLIWGNAYILKERDRRGVVTALYPLHPPYVKPLIAADGSVYYQCQRDGLSTVAPGVDADTVTIPAREIIHDRMICLWHPLIGVSPLYAAGAVAVHGSTIQSTSTTFFGSGSNPGGVLSAPGAIKDDTAKRLKDYWDTNFSGNNVGKVAVLGDGLKYEAMAVNAVDSQLIDQLNWTTEQICQCYGVPMFLLNSTKGAPYANNEPVIQLYFAQCLQSLIVNLEASLDDGLEVGLTLGTELDLDDLIWMDTPTRTKAASEAIGCGAMTPNEARQKYFALGPVKGGDTPYMQQQYFSLAALAERDAEQPFSKATPAAAPATTTPDDAASEDDFFEAAALALLRKDWSVLCAS